MQRLLRVLIPLIILAIGYVSMRGLARKEAPPEIEKKEKKKLQVEATALKKEDYQVILKTQGIVRASNETTVTAQISGKVVKIQSEFEDGAFFKKGDILLELDPVDFEAALSSAEANLARSEASLIQENARAKQAKLNWDDIGYDEPPSDLVLRKPQLKQAEANVKASKAALEQAQRNLIRTKVRAPYDGRVRTRSVGLGQVIGGSTPLGSIFSTETAEVRLPLSPFQLDFIDLSQKTNEEDVKVTLYDNLSNELPLSRKATLVRTAGTLDNNSRELFVIVRIDDPFSINSDSPIYRIGQPVRAEIPGKILQNVFAIPRNALRTINQIVLIDQETKKISREKITSLWSDEEVLITEQDLNEGDYYPTSPMPYAPVGEEVEILEPKTEEVAPNSNDSVGSTEEKSKA